MFDVIVILGKSGSGKDTLAKRLTKDKRFNLVVTATTRPKRDYEIDGVDYVFMKEKEFKQAEKIEEASFNGWYYGTPISALSKDKINIIVINPDGFISLSSNKNINIIGAFELQVSDKQRLLRQLNREDNPNVKEIIRRYNTDDDDFTEFEYAKHFLNLQVQPLENEDDYCLDQNCVYIWAKTSLKLGQNQIIY